MTDQPGTDGELLRQAQAGNPQALQALVRRYQGKIYGFGLRMCNDSEEAKDVLQDTLLSVARGIRGFRGESSITTWFYTIARSMCIKSRRKSKFAPTHTLDIDELGHEPVTDSKATPDSALQELQVQRALERSLRALEPSYREVLVLRDLEGLSTPEVARILSSSEAAVKSRLHRARAALRELLATAIGEIPIAARGAECPDIVSLFSKYLEGDITPEVCSSMQSHVDSCARCSSACDSLRRMLSVCSAVETAKVPVDIERGIREQLRSILAEGHGKARNNA